jgi:hypothetical protein
MWEYFLLVVLPVICYGISPETFPFGNHDYESLKQILKSTNERCPDITRLYRGDKLNSITNLVGICH